MNGQVILVDSNDFQVGTMAKLEAHQSGVLHRAFSVFVFNSQGELLLQQRAMDKYHSAGLWSNTCCSHPAPGELTDAAASRRLREEMHMVCPLEYAFGFIYMAEFSNGLTEHEFDHVYIGNSDVHPVINKAEVKDWKYMSIPELQHDIEQFPLRYTEWLKDCLQTVIKHRSNNMKQVK